MTSVAQSRICFIYILFSNSRIFAMQAAKY